MYLGFAAGEPVATAMLHVHRGVAGIYAVSTVEPARRRGYGRALSEFAAREGFDAGCRVSFLQASSMGYPVYLAIGYRRVFDHVSWTPPAADGSVVE